MPRTGPKSSAGLGIELDDPQPVYLPGDTIKGCLFGRAKTKYTVKTQNGKSIERGRALFFEEVYLLHKGSVTSNDGGRQAWPFVIIIPQTSQPEFAARNDCDEFRADSPFLHTRDAEKKEIDVTRHPLPSIMYYKSESGMSGKTVEAYIEYVLLAEGANTTATYPLYVRQRSIPHPIQDFKMQTRTFQKVIKTPKLLAEHAETDLTSKQKSRMLFRPSKTPRYGYTIKVEYPTVIQLERPAPIPLKIYMVPDLDPKKTTIDSVYELSGSPAVRIINMEFKLLGDVSIRCPGMMWDSGTEKNHTFEFSFREALQSTNVPIVPTSSTDLQQVKSIPEPSSDSKNGVPLTNAHSTPPMNVWQNTEGTEVVHTPAGWRPVHTTTPTGSDFALNVGEHAAILLGCSASSTLSRPPVSFKRQVYPTFATYNIHIKYRLKWKLYLICAGEAHEVSGEAPVTVLAPSEEQEEQKTRELGREGMKKNYDDLENGLGSAIQFIGQILQAVV